LADGGTGACAASLGRAKAATGSTPASPTGDLAEMTGLARKPVNGHLLRLQKADIVRLACREARILNQPRLRALIDQNVS
jgi:hypothetical protein